MPPTTEYTQTLNKDGEQMNKEDRQIGRELRKTYQLIEETGLQKQMDDIKALDERRIRCYIRDYLYAFGLFRKSKAGSKEYRDSVELMNSTATMMTINKV